MITEVGTVEVKIGKSKYSRDYEFMKFQTAQDVLDAISTDKGLTEHLRLINDKLDADAKTKTRNAINANEGAKALAEEKSIKDIMKRRADAGRPVTEEQARKLFELMETMNV